MKGCGGEVVGKSRAFIQSPGCAAVLADDERKSIEGLVGRRPDSTLRAQHEPGRRECAVHRAQFIEATVVEEKLAAHFVDIVTELNARCVDLNMARHSRSGLKAEQHGLALAFPS